MTPRLTKSLIASFLQCPRKLWLQVKQPELMPKDDPGSGKFKTYGNWVGEAARHRLGKFIWVQRPQDDDEINDATQEQLAQAGDAFVEVPIMDASGHVLCRADALIPTHKGSNAFILEETKAAKFPLRKDGTPGHMESHYLQDIAIQYWAFQSAGIPIEKATLNLIEPDFSLDAPRKIDEMGDWVHVAFRQADVTEDVREMQQEVITWVKQAQDVIHCEDMPEACIGSQCASPTPCPFKGHCKALQEQLNLPPALTLLPDVSGKALAKRLRGLGYTNLLEVPPHELVSASDDKRSALYRRIQQAHASGQPVLDLAGLDAIRNIPYPRYWFDFEGIDLPLPIWPGMGAFEQAPFQWSCHVEEGAGAPLRHEEFLDISGDDPSWACLQHMIRVLGDGYSGSIVVYHATYERGRMKYLAERFPQHADLIGRWMDRLVDLLPLVKNCFYAPSMSGSFSIKVVLEALAPDLSYKDLEQVQNGVEAQWAYLDAALLGKSEEERQTLDKNLRLYCGRDSYAMFVVAQRLLEFPATNP